ncbi:armadillo-type protein [Sporodiniella umbellata]|nr:armadillo-type protein [Sporodiniella umbellata]
MKLWPAIIAQLTADAPEVRKGTAWVCGTAVQNNTQAQKAFMKHGGLEPLLKLLSEDTDSQVRNKALYAISGFIKHNDEGRQAFEQQGGYKVMRAIMKGEDVNMLRKVVFLYNSLMFDDPALPKKLAEDGTLDEFKRVMAEYSEDEDMVEKAQCAIDTLNDNIKA